MKFTWRYLLDLRLAMMSINLQALKITVWTQNILLELSLIDSLKQSRSMDICKVKLIILCSQNTLQKGKVSILSVYVNDIIVTRSYIEEMKLLKRVLAKEFEIKDLGNWKYFLGMEVARSKKLQLVSHRKYILDLLGQTGMLGCKPTDTPMKLGLKEDSSPVDKGRYQRLVGNLSTSLTLDQILVFL